MLHEIIGIQLLPQEEKSIYHELRKSLEITNATNNNTQELIERAKIKKLAADYHFSIETYLKKANEINRKSNEVLDYLFAYVRYVLEHTRRKMYEKLRFYQVLIYQINPSEIAKSMSKQQKIQAERKQELDDLQKQIGYVLKLYFIALIFFT